MCLHEGSGSVLRRLGGRFWGREERFGRFRRFGMFGNIWK